MKAVIFGLATALLASPAFADVHLTIQDGRVSIVAKEATVRQILTEWARVGHTTIVNVERIPGGPVTIELHNVTEMHALDVLLRSLSGYIAAPRAVGAANLSTFDRIIIMPTLAATRPAVSASASPSTPLPVFQQVPQFQQPVEDDQAQPGRDQDDERPAANAAVQPQMNMAFPPQMNRAAPALNTFPTHALEVAPQGVIPGGVLPSPTVQPQTPVTDPRSPFSAFGRVGVPGMIAPAPTQQGQPGQPGQIQPPGAPVQPVRRPGGP